MKPIKKNNGVFTALIFIMMASLSLFTQCKKETETVTVTMHDTTIIYLDPNDTGIFVPGTANVDTSWTFDVVHSNVMWESKYYDFSATMLTGRFNVYGFIPKFKFDETNLAATDCNFWVQTSTFNTGQPGRDGLGKCGLNYQGIVYLDSAKTLVDHLSDTAKFRVNSVTVDTHEGYILHGTLTFNRYRTPSGYPDGTPITKNIDANLSYNGMRDFDSNNDGTYDKLRAGFTTTFVFYRSDFMDNASTKPFFPVPTVADSIANITAANNKTYGVWSASVADKMEITVNCQFYKNH
ncbi:MAG TPA: YceI family protein [Bacteroidia bacterium]|nr:YceI family protein [Bacteroidia bacterium]